MSNVLCFEKGKGLIMQAKGKLVMKEKAKNVMSFRD